MRRLAAIVTGALTAGIVAVGVLFLSVEPASASQVTLRIEGVRSDDGLVRIGVFHRTASFPSDGRVLGLDVTAQRGSVVAVIPSLEPGEYAIAIHHDEDGDGEFDTDFIGLPEEGYGFSNDAPVSFGPPDFDDAKIVVGDDGIRTALRVRY